MKFETKAIHTGEEPNFKEGASGDAVCPIHLASTFAREKVDFPTSGYEYSRSNNPTRFALEKRLAARPSITVPNITIGSDFDGANADGKAYANKFTSKYEHRILKDIGHNVPQEDPKAFAKAIIDVDHFGK